MEDTLSGPSHALDVNTTIQELRKDGFNCYVLGITDAAPFSFNDLKRLLPAAGAAGISVWAEIFPPSEGANSLPYRANYTKWMSVLAKLSLAQPALKGVNIDDFLSGVSSKTFTRQSTCNLYQVKQQINPKLLFLPTIYELDEGVADRLNGCVDGVWLWWTNLEHNDSMRTLLEDSQSIVAGRFPVYTGVYAHSTSWHKEGVPPRHVLKGALEIACRYSSGAIIWNPALGPDEAGNSLLPVVRSFGEGGTANLAGKCGVARHQQPDRVSGG